MENIKSQMTKLEIIEELFDNGYCKDPSTRGFNGDACTYYDPTTGNKCAIGKTLKNPEKEDYQIIGSIEDLCDQFDLNEIQKEKYLGHEATFWQELQMLHDIDFNEDGTGLSIEGKQRLIYLKKKYEKS